MGWLDLLALQGTLKSLLQHHSSKASILQVWGGIPRNGISKFPGDTDAAGPRTTL